MSRLPLFFLSLVGLLPACGSTETGSTSAASSCSAYQVPAGPDLTQPVSFRSDVMPIFHAGCGFSSCHGSSSATTNHGLMLGGTDASKVRAGLVDIVPNESTMKYVAAGDPSRSYLLHKLDGDLCSIQSECNGGDCLSPMPMGNDALPVETRDVIRRWIAQGAPDN